MRSVILVDRHRVVQWVIPRNGAIVVDIILRRRAPGPDDDRVRIRVARCNSMSEIKLGCSESSSRIVSFIDLVSSATERSRPRFTYLTDADTQARMVMRWATVVEVTGKGRGRAQGKRQYRQKLLHYYTVSFTSSRASKQTDN